MPEKAEKGLLKVILVWTQQEESGRESFHLLGEFVTIGNRMLTEIWTVKASVVWSQVEMRSMLLDNGETILGIEQLRTCPSCVHVLGKVGLARGGIG